MITVRDSIQHVRKNKRTTGLNAKSKHQIKSTMSGKLTQDNLYLLLPGKVLAVAQMYARHHNVSVLDAMRIVYASDMYKQLEQESTKRWHEGPVSLYQTL